MNDFGFSVKVYRVLKISIFVILRACNMYLELHYIKDGYSNHYV